MDVRIREMLELRQRLQNSGKVIPNEEIADILLMRVTATHRDVVRQFSRVMGSKQPTMEQVMNALLAETEVDNWINQMQNKKYDDTLKIMAQGSGPPKD